MKFEQNSPFRKGFPKWNPLCPRNGWNKTFHPCYCNRGRLPCFGAALFLSSINFQLTPYCYRKSTCPIQPVPSVPVRLRRIFVSQGQGIGQRNQRWTAAARFRMDFGVFLGWPWCVAPTAKSFRLNLAHLTLLPGDTQLPNIAPILRMCAGNSKICGFTHRTPFPSLPIRVFPQKKPCKIA